MIDYGYGGEEGCWWLSRRERELSWCISAATVERERERVN